MSKQKRQQPKEVPTWLNNLIDRKKMNDRQTKPEPKSSLLKHKYKGRPVEEKIVPKKRKKLVTVQGSLIKKVIRIANTNGRTVDSFVNEIMEQAVEAEEVGRSLKEIVELHKLMEIEIQTGSILVPKEIISFLIERVFKEENEPLTYMFYQMGQWFGKYCQVRFSGEDPLGVIEKTLGRLFWDVSEFDITKDGDGILVQCIGSRISGSYTTLLSMFLEGLMHTFEYSTIKRDVSKGIISLGFR